MPDSASSDVKTVCEQYGIDVEILREYEFYPRKAAIVGGALRLVTDRQTVYLKRAAVSHRDHLQAIYEAVEGLFARGARVRRFLHTKYGDPYVVHETGLYYAMLQVSGSLPDLEVPQDFLQAISTLAEWHASAKTSHEILYQPRRVDLTYQWNLERAKLEVYREYALQREESTELDQRYLAIREDLDRQVGVALAKLKQISYDRILQEAFLRGELCHGSFVRQNLVQAKDGLYVLDHDHIYRGSQMLDLANFYQRYAAQQSFEIALCQRALAIYERIRPIREEEWQLLEVLLSFPASLLRVLEWYYGQRRDWEIEDFIDAFEDASEMNVARSAWHRHLFGAVVEPPPVPLREFFEKYSSHSIAPGDFDHRDEDHPKEFRLYEKRGIETTAFGTKEKSADTGPIGLWRPIHSMFGNLGGAKKESDQNKDQTR
ncbi:hypothetical protein [Sulfoacidibacillus thermotolerans]|uniref:Aminoglycoside phosphotransferase domain-containing protein n=1 Tax=Sulfoacidibacillus thermotolerans TaxID=1765684 RepID=A0A2U3DC30_SULT2|nr:hypothetical protein [Sulfoacidibacillus thermotolerans]PWI58844.1 hypothetical protein BM613_01780 [Sulfoacidibacillus thermotolerans]